MADETTGTDNSEQQEVETDWQAKYEAMRKHSRDWESKAKANQDAADELEKLRAKGKSEQEKATARAEKAEAELAELKAQAQRQTVIAGVADKANVPTEVVAMLNGADEAELAEQVKRLLALLPGYPTRTDDGGGHAIARKTGADRLSEALFG